MRGAGMRDAGYRVIVIDNLVTGFAWTVDPRATFVEMAVEDASVRDVIANHDVCAILHFAGSVVVPESVADRAADGGAPRG